MVKSNTKEISQFCQKAIYYLAIFCAIIPIFFWIKSIFPMVLPKTLLFRGTIELMLFFYLILIYFDKEFLPKLTRLNLSLLIFTLISFITGFLGVSPFNSMFSTAERMMGNFGYLHFVVFAFILSSTIKSKDTWLYILKAWAWVSGIISTLFYLATIIPSSPVSILNSEPGRYVGFTGNSTFTGVFLLLQTLLCLYLYFEELEKDLPKLHFFVLFLINSFLLFLTGCRGAMLSWITCIGMLLICLAILDHKKINSLYHINIKKLAIFFLITLGSLGIIFFTLRETPLVKNNVPLQRLTSIPFLNQSALSRIWVSRIALKAFIQKPLTGWGPENFEIAYQRNYDPMIAKILPNDNRFDKVHNMHLEVLATTGIFGFISYLAIYYFFYKDLRKSSSFSFWPKIVLTLFLLGYFLQNIFLFDVIEGLTLLFLIFAFIISQSVPIQIKYPKISIPKWLSSILVAICSIILLFTIYIYNIKVFTSSSNEIKIKKLMSRGSLDEGIALMKQNYASNTFIKDFFIFGDLEYIAGTDIKKMTLKRLEDLYIFFTNESTALSRYHPLNLRLYVARLLIILSKSRWNNDELNKEDIIQLRKINDEIQKTKLYLPDTDFYYSEVLIKSANPKDQEEALALLKDFYARIPELVRTPWLIGVYLVEHNRIPEGLEYLQKAIHTGPVFNTPQEAIGGINLFLKLNDSKTALEIAKMLEKETKNEPLVYITLARVYQKEGDNKKALEYILRAKQLYDIYSTKQTDPQMEAEISKILKELSN